MEDSCRNLCERLLPIRFFLEEADPWRKDAWQCIKARPDLCFLIPTKRIERAAFCLPQDWQDGYENVAIAVSVETQAAAEERLRAFMDISCRHRMIFTAPLLERLDLSVWLKTGQFELVSVAGECGLQARVCDFEWFRSLFRDCLRFDTGFEIHRIGRHLLKNGRLYTLSKQDQFTQAKKAMLWLEKHDGLQSLSLLDPEPEKKAEEIRY